MGDYNGRPGVCTLFPGFPWLLEYVSPRHGADGALKNGWEGQKPGGGRPTGGGALVQGRLSDALKAGLVSSSPGIPGTY